MDSKFIIRVIIITIALTILEFLFDIVSGYTREYTSYLWNFLANSLIAVVMGYYIIYSTYHSYKLWLSTMVILFVIGNFNLQIEAIVFNVTDRALSLNILLIGIPFSLISSLIMVFLYGRWKKDSSPVPAFKPRKVQSWIAKILAGNFLYFFFYITAGIMLQTFTPRFNEFYGDKLPSMADIIVTNMFFRGFVFVGIAILIDRTITVTKWSKAILIGSIFSILGGIAPLLIPNELMPRFIRIAHGFEVGISNFLYGALVLLILTSIPITNGSDLKPSLTSN